MTAGAIAAALYPSYPPRSWAACCGIATPRRSSSRMPKRSSACARPRLRGGAVDPPHGRGRRRAVPGGLAEPGARGAGGRARPARAPPAGGRPGRSRHSVSDFRGHRRAREMALGHATERCSPTSQWRLRARSRAGRFHARFPFFGHTCSGVVIELLPLACGLPVWFSESLLRLPQELKRIQADLFRCATPVVGACALQHRAELRKRSRLTQRLFEAALELSLEAISAAGGRRAPEPSRTDSAAARRPAPVCPACAGDSEDACGCAPPAPRHWARNSTSSFWRSGCRSSRVMDSPRAAS